MEPSRTSRFEGGSLDSQILAVPLTGLGTRPLRYDHWTLVEQDGRIVRHVSRYRLWADGADDQWYRWDGDDA